MQKKYEYDELKDRSNIEKHGVSLGYANFMQMDTAVIKIDNRKSYGETRYNVQGPINGRLYAMTFTLRGGNIRVISLRKSNTREVKNYENTKT